MKRIFTLTALVLLLGMISCKSEVNTNSKEMGIEIKLPGNTQRAAYYTQEDAADYVITIKKENTLVKETSGKPGQTVKVVLEEEGNYDIELKAYNEKNVLIAEGSTSSNIRFIDGIVKVKITLIPKQKPEIGFDIEVEWGNPAEESDILKVYEIVREGFGSKIFSFYEDGTIICSEKCQIGNSSITVTFYKGTYNGDPTKDGVIKCLLLYSSSDERNNKINELIDAEKENITDEDLPPLEKQDRPESVVLSIKNGEIEFSEPVNVLNVIDFYDDEGYGIALNVYFYEDNTCNLVEEGKYKNADDTDVFCKVTMWDCFYEGNPTEDGIINITIISARTDDENDLDDAINFEEMVANGKTSVTDDDPDILSMITLSEPHYAEIKIENGTCGYFRIVEDEIQPSNPTYDIEDIFYDDYSENGFGKFIINGINESSTDWKRGMRMLFTKHSDVTAKVILDEYSLDGDGNLGVVFNVSKNYDNTLNFGIVGIGYDPANQCGKFYVSHYFNIAEDDMGSKNFGAHDFSTNRDITRTQMDSSITTPYEVVIKDFSPINGIFSKNEDDSSILNGRISVIVKVEEEYDGSYNIKLYPESAIDDYGYISNQIPPISEVRMNAYTIGKDGPAENRIGAYVNIFPTKRLTGSVEIIELRN